MKYAVRCCCTPTKVFGHLEGPDNVRSFRVLDKEYKEYKEYKVRELRVETIALPDHTSPDFYRYERAIYSEDRPLEFWANIRGFTMTKQYHPDGMLPGLPAIFVFGSNLAGQHAGGAAKAAAEHFSAVTGEHTGRTGSSYAIPTCDAVGMPLPLERIEEHVNDFLDHAVLSIPQQFFVTRIGCGIAGYRDEQIAPMFKNAPGNCSLPDTWQEWVER